MSEKIQLTPLLYLDCETRFNYKTIPSTIMPKPGRATAPVFCCATPVPVLHRRNSRCDSRRVKAAIRTGRPRGSRNRPRARGQGVPDSGNGICYPLNPRLRNHCQFTVVYNEPNSAPAKVAVHGKCCTDNQPGHLAIYVSGLAISAFFNAIGPLADNSTLRCVGRDAGGAD